MEPTKTTLEQVNGLAEIAEFMDDEDESAQQYHPFNPLSWLNTEADEPSTISPFAMTGTETAAFTAAIAAQLALPL